MTHEQLLQKHPELGEPKIQELLTDICTHMRRAAPAVAPMEHVHIMTHAAGQTQGWMMAAERLNGIHVPMKKQEPQQKQPLYVNPNPPPKPDGNAPQS